MVRISADESFAVNMTRFRTRSWDWRRALVVNTVSNLTWIAATIAEKFPAVGHAFHFRQISAPPITASCRR